MKLSILSLLLIVCFEANSQNHSKIEMSGNNNFVKVYQGDNLVSYNLNLNKDLEELLLYLKNIPSIKKQLQEINSTLSSINKNGSKIDNLLLELIKNSSKTGYISIEDYNKGLERYFLENKNLKDEILTLKSKNENNSFEKVLNIAEQKIQNFDNIGFQSTLDDFKVSVKGKILHLQKEVAQASYLQAYNNTLNFKYNIAFEQINDAIKYDEINIKYWILKGDILNFLFKTDSSLIIYNHAIELAKNKRIEADIQNKIGLVYFNKGNYDKSLAAYMSCLDYRLTHKDSTEKEELREIYNNIGHIYNGKEDFESAVAFLEKSIEIDKGEKVDSLTLGGSFVNLSMSYTGLKKFEDAIKYGQLAIRCFNIQKGFSKGKAHAYGVLALAYNLNEDYEKAQIMILASTQMFKKIYGEEHPLIAINYHNLAMVLKNLKDYNTAIHFFKLSLNIKFKILGQEHIDEISTLNNLGNTYLELNSLDSADICFQKAIQIQSKLYGDKNIVTEEMIQSISFKYMFLDNQDYALKFLNMISTYKNLKSIEKVEQITYMGVQFFKDNSYTDAIKCYKMALYIFNIENISKEERIFPIILQNLAKAHCYNNDKSLALKIFNEALLLSKKLPDDGVMKKIQSNIEDCSNRE